MRRPALEARLQVGRDERGRYNLDLDPDFYDDECGWDCPCCDWGTTEDDDDLALFLVASLSAALYRPFAGLQLPR